jgi:hypothetical protein
MKTKSPLLTSIGALALFVLVAFPSSSARASQGQCGDVDFEPYYFPWVILELTVEPEDCVIYYTTTLDDPNIVDPSRSGATPIAPTLTCPSSTTFSTPSGKIRRMKAFAWKPGWAQSVNITFTQVHYP